MTILWKALALQDIQQIHAHIAHYAGTGRANQALAAIYVKTNALADHPGRGRVGRKPDTRYILVTDHDNTYRATYRIRGQVVVMLRVRNTRPLPSDNSGFE